MTEIARIMKQEITEFIHRDPWSTADKLIQILYGSIYVPVRVCYVFQG